MDEVCNSDVYGRLLGFGFIQFYPTNEIRLGQSIHEITPLHISSITNVNYKRCL
jgi:hypothetical protein